MKYFSLAVACKEFRMAVLLIRLRRLALLVGERGGGGAVSEVILDDVDAAHRKVLHARLATLTGPAVFWLPRLALLPKAGSALAIAANTNAQGIVRWALAAKGSSRGACPEALLRNIE